MKKDGSPPKTALKKTYGKPTISEVKLRPEEAVLGNCKVGGTGVGGPFQGACSSPAACSTLGS